ncbi:MAG: N-acetylmuramoyl-L-alanine amidase [Acutalibacteraceae bacterium]|uniref:N-acetylmuramoyl-L-alanine amidase n=1 Tax=Anaeromassilibacillus sp. An172 TaxID=1965570 RepID=UPI001302AB85|nr:N-acetylmuramoyl-L-alanine amidase [Anaeromassilibacillus sp. An172]MEE0762979.1 N-acetylmuramoyl-L-alanine amidase [Acutalibacteraceae bacterium]
MKRVIKICAAVLLSLTMLGWAVSASEISDSDFQVDQSELNFLYEFCSEAFVDDNYYSQEFLSAYQQALDNTKDVLENYSQQQGEEAYWNLYKAFNQACVYTDVTGDLNGDGICDISDCTQLQKCIAGLEPMTPMLALKLGLSGDNPLGVDKVTKLQGFMAGTDTLENSEAFETLKDNVDTRDISLNSIFYESYLSKDEVQPNGIKIYLSPSNQDANIYAIGNTNEMIQCNIIAEAVEEYLLEHGFNVKRAPMNQDMYVTIDESNYWGADLHVPIHTNAFDGSLTGGTLIMIYNFADTENVKAARNILDSLAPITPGSDYPLKQRKDLHELSDIEAMSVYVECEHHDTVEGANFIINNTDKIAEAIAKGICNYYGIEW